VREKQILGESAVVSISVEDLNLLKQQIVAEIDAQHKRDRLLGLVWATIFFLLGIPVPILIQHL
jgi:hypothetical protein